MRRRGVCAYLVATSWFSAALAVLLLGVRLGWEFLAFPWCSSPFPVRHHGNRCEVPVWLPPSLLLFSSNKSTASSPADPAYLFSPIFRQSSSISSRSSVPIDKSGHGEVQTTRSRCAVCTPVLGGIHRLETGVPVRTCLLDREVAVWAGSRGSMASHGLSHTGSGRCYLCCVSVLTICCGKWRVLDSEFSKIQILLVCRLMVDMRFGVRCGLQNLHFSVVADGCVGKVPALLLVLDNSFPVLLARQRRSVFWILEHFVRGVERICIMCFFILGTRLVNGHSEGGVSSPSGLIHRWQVRESLSLIPRSDGRERTKLSSVLLLTDLQLNFSSPHVHLPARLLGESLALRLARTLEAFEDFSCGVVPDFSPGSPSDSGCGLPCFWIVCCCVCNQDVLRSTYVSSPSESLVTPFV